MPTRKTKSTLVKENTKCSQPPRKSKKADYRQFTEARYKKMSDEEFIKAFVEEHSDDDRFYTQIKAKYIPFFMANISREDQEELQGQIDCGEVNLIEWLEDYPDLIGRLPNSVLWQLQSDEKIMLLIHRPEKAEFIVPMLQGDDIWAFMLPQYRRDLRNLGIKLCPWETMTESQIRFMKLQSKQLKKFIESHKLG